MKASVEATETEIWNRTIRPEIGDLSPAAARELLRLHLTDDDAARAGTFGQSQRWFAERG